MMAIFAPDPISFCRATIALSTSRWGLLSGTESTSSRVSSLRPCRS